MKYVYLITSIICGIFLTNFAFANNSKALTIEYEIYENIVVWGCDYYNGKKGIKIEILSVTGGNGNYSVSVNGDGFAEPSTMSEGEGFVYFFSGSDISAGNVGFTVSETQGNQQKTMEANLIFVLSSLSIPIHCGAPNKCSLSRIEHTQDDRIDTDVYQVTDRIVSCGVIPERSTSYIAVNEICLNSGFEVKLISNFTADIERVCTD